MFRIPRLDVLYISTLLCLILSAFPHICVFVILKKRFTYIKLSRYSITGSYIFIQQTHFKCVIYLD